MSSAVSDDTATLRSRVGPLQSDGKSQIPLPLPVDKLAQDARLVSLFVPKQALIANQLFALQWTLNSRRRRCPSIGAFDLIREEAGPRPQPPVLHDRLRPPCVAL